MVLEALKSLDDDRKIKDSLSSPDKYKHLSKAIQHWMNAWPTETRIVDRLRASQLYYTCPREFILAYWMPRPGGAIDWQSQLRMSMGTFLHKYLQNRVLGPMGVLYGNWTQLTVGDVPLEKKGFYPEPERALWEMSKERPLTWIYKEENVWDEHYRISGHLDGQVDINRIAWLHENEKLFKKDPRKALQEIMRIEESDRCLLEIKTTGSYVFNKLEGPGDIADYYKVQANVYQKLKENSRTVFWYMERDSLSSKVMIYEYDKGWWRDVKRKARIIWEAIRDETLPESMMVCKLPTDARAKTCPHREECWMRSFDVKSFIENAKKSQPDRTWLDLNEWNDD